jgi:hypothetical protein
VPIFLIWSIVMRSSEKKLAIADSWGVSLYRMWF